MVDVANKLDIIEKNVMGGLKDFQVATVNRIAELFKQGQRRVLVSDEVGLGKTLIAKGTVAKFAVMRKFDDDPLVKVVYICSNAAIAEQNLKKLQITNELKTDSMNSSRLSMQHLNIFMQEQDEELLARYIQLIPLTPDTSFRITSGCGTASERALMFAVLRRLPMLQEYLPELEVAMIDWAVSAWSGLKDKYETAVIKCNDSGRIKGEYLKYLLPKCEEMLLETQPDGTTYYECLTKLCKAISENGMKRVNNTEAIGKLRLMFSKISLDKLEPDLVIMDEFQRFKYLITSNPESETGMLAEKFFKSNDTKMLLLSATPYKMYSTLEEIDESQNDEHYSEFLNVMNFLIEKPSEQKAFCDVWSNYSVKLKELTAGGTTVIAAKKAAEEEMFGRVCRTERISATENADIIDDSSIKKPVKVSELDIKSYISVEKLLDEIGAPFHVPVDYVKSTPYLLSFMKNYQLKKHIEDYFKKHPNEINKINKEGLWLSKAAINAYKPVPRGNARLEALTEHAMAGKSELLLWVPPSKPYYKVTKGAYKDAKDFSKILVFSSWEMVPRMISVMLSYEAERKTIGNLSNDRAGNIEKYHYFKKNYYPGYRKIWGKDGQPGAGFSLLYPSRFLSAVFNPIDCLNDGLSLYEIEKKIRKTIKEALSRFEKKNSGQVDSSWYYLAPMLLDGEYAARWLKNMAEKDSSADDNFDDENNGKEKYKIKDYIEHLEQLYSAAVQNIDILGKMPEDIEDVLTDMAIASPSVCIARAYEKYAPKDGIGNYSLPSQAARVFVKRMNTPEATAVVDLCFKKRSDEAHWLNLLSYCKEGNIQAMLDEYIHLIANGIDRDENAVKKIHNEFIESINFQSTTYDIDTKKSFRSRTAGGQPDDVRLRSHFAVAFTKGDGDSEKTIDRKKTVRKAFNSPLRPFVLASTSIGQEGLDFHYYCRKIVHWNLPSNPIDLEQREGRINRFECLAIRQNIARRYGERKFNSSDVWTEMFNNAAEDTLKHKQHSSDLIPFWGLPEAENMVKIERIVPMYPFSRDIEAYERMIKILSLYRLTLGHARQEELLEYIFRNSEAGSDFKELFINLSPHYRHSGDCCETGNYQDNKNDRGEK